jgi:uncharacterized protein YcfJ
MRKNRSIATGMAMLFTVTAMLGCGDMSHRDADTVGGAAVGGVVGNQVGK